MKIKRELMTRVESFLETWPYDHEEQGGYLFRNRLGVTSDFLPVPNISPTPKLSFQRPVRSLELAKRYANARRMQVEALWHSHPEPCIMSAADAGYAEANSGMAFVTITPTGNWSRSRKDYQWYACIGVKPVKIEVV